MMDTNRIYNVEKRRRSEKMKKLFVMMLGIVSLGVAQAQEQTEAQSVSQQLTLSLDEAIEVLPESFAEKGRYNKYTAKRNFIVPAGNSEGIPSEGEVTAQAVYLDPETLQPYEDRTVFRHYPGFLSWRTLKTMPCGSNDHSPLHHRHPLWR